jgi:8-oxo-dGTP pyrophosphatase MutT (NUDIX family)
MSWPPKGSFGSRTASPLRVGSAPAAASQRGAPSQQGVLAAGVILLREPEEGEMEVLIGRYEVINAFRSERHRKCVPMRFAGEYHFPGGAKRQTDLGPLQTACRELHEEFGVGVHLGTKGAGMQAEAMGPPELAATLFCKAHVALCSSGD